MPYRRDQFQEFTEVLHHLAHQTLRRPLTPDEQILDIYTKLKRQLLAEFPSEGVLLNPTTFRSGVVEAVKLLQEMHETRETVFSSRLVPFEHILLSPNTQLASVTFTRPTRELLHRHPNGDFPATTREGLFLQGDDLHMVMLDPQNRQRDLRPMNGLITAAAPEPAKLIVSLAAWAIDPVRISANP